MFQEPTGRSGARVVFLVPVRAADTNITFLSAIPAAVAANGTPVVLAVDPSHPWRPELLDFLRRYQPDQIWTLGAIEEPGAQLAGSLRSIDADSPEAIACELAERFFGASREAVACTFVDRAAALGAAVLAGRLGVPLLPCGRDGFSDDVASLLRTLGVERVFLVGRDLPAEIPGTHVERLLDATDVAGCMDRRGLKVRYIAAVNAADGHASPARELSLVAALLAAGREGAIAPTPEDVQWKHAVAASSEVQGTLPGARPSGSGWRRGTLGDGETARDFVTGVDPASGRAFLQYDANGDGGFDGPGEGPLVTGDEVVIAGRRFAISLDADEMARGDSVWLTSPTASEIVGAVRRVRTAAQPPADTLCLVGWPQTLPMAIVGDAIGIDADLVSDVPLAQTDEDPFVELSFARFLAEDLCSGSLLACRGLVVADLADRSFAGRYATAEWANPSQPLFESVGMVSGGHHAGESVIDPSSPLTGVGWILHSSHSMWTELGTTCAWDSEVLLSPCLVQSDGCSTAALDMDPEHRSVAARLLRNGALAFVGHARRNTAVGEIFTSEFTNAVLAGQTLGQAHRSAINRMTVAALARGQASNGVYHYQRHIATAYGDPAVSFVRPPTGGLAAARLEIDGAHATVVMTGPWLRSDYEPLAEWGSTATRIYTWRAIGVGAESSWYPPENRNQDELVFTAEARTTREVMGVEAIGDPEARWGFDGSVFFDHHEDGSRSVFWRVRLIDFDMTTGIVRAQRDRAEFRLLER